MRTKVAALWAVAVLCVASVVALAVPSQAEQISISALTDYQVVTESESYLLGTDNLDDITAQCPTGLHVIGGGALPLSHNSSTPSHWIGVDYSGPSNSNTAWVAGWALHNAGSGITVDATVYAICANTD